MNQEDIELLEDLFLLAMLNKESDETIDDIINILVEGKALNFDEAKEIVNNLKTKGAIVDNDLSFLGLTLANIAKEKFKLK
ncbi:conserved hypothetical protein [Sulfurovum sp. enrichment culture clone C5]|uniref:Uncharacterized protein n=1 Tax=Sulfurovum sp. enrichment culture clone C5 TaxID=497650 RepID=A0A0S4XQZ2_9BACT|nr:conserved hypothetical protein [Sulfurovum sp. enrichment culture clone C5]